MVAVVAYDSNMCPVPFVDHFTETTTQCHCSGHASVALAWLKDRFVRAASVPDTSIHVKLHHKHGVRRCYRAEVFILSQSGVVRRFAESDAFVSVEDVNHHMHVAVMLAHQKLSNLV